MKKIIILLTTLLLVSGCHGKSSQSSFVMPEEFDETQNYEITFWAKNDTNKKQVQTYQNAVDSFEKLYPNVHITVKYYTDYSKIYNDVITNITTNTTPNVCIGYPDNVVTYMSGNNVCVKLDELMDNPKYGLGGSSVKYDSVKKEEIIPQYLNECFINDGYYLLPFVRSTEAIYINKTYVEKLGYEIPDILTWDFVFEVSEKALEKNEDGTYKVNGQNVMIPFIYKSTDNLLIQMLKQKNADYSNENGDILVFNNETKEILKLIASHAKSYAFSTFKIDSYPGNFLNAGQCLFGIDSTAGSTWMGSQAINSDISEENIVDFETVVRMIPQYDVNNPQMISQGPSICVFNKENPQEVLASWLFAQYLLTNETQLSYAETEGYSPVTNKAKNSLEYQDYLSKSGLDNDTYYNIKIDATKILLDNVDKTFVTKVFNGSASLRDASTQLVEDVVKAVRRKTTIDDDYLDELFTKVNFLYKLDEHKVGISGKKDLGELPLMSKCLLGTLCITWLGLGTYYVIDLKNKKEKAN